MSILDPPTDFYEADISRIQDQRLAVCLSGGGYRAAIFHLGALRRLNELGVLSKIETITSVSGGSIIAAHLATRVGQWPAAGEVVAEWDERIENPFRKFVTRNIRTWPLLKRVLFPWNWLRPSTQVKALEGCYWKHLTRLELVDLPARPNFVFCATDMVYGVSWVFERQRVGSYQAGYFQPPAGYPLARAVAASSCFPPVFSPLPIDVPPVATPRAVENTSKFVGMCVCDGGLYDNLGLQPAERFGKVLVSDGGQPFVAAVPHGLLGYTKAYIHVGLKQPIALRKRILIGQFKDGTRTGAYWGVGSAATRYKPDASEGYSKDVALNVIGVICTDLDAFSDAEIAVLENHGYQLADIAVQTHIPDLISQHAPLRSPYPDWMEESKVRAALHDSSKTLILGRWRW